MFNNPNPSAFVYDPRGIGAPPVVGMIQMFVSNDVRDVAELNDAGWYLCDGPSGNAASHPNASMVPDLTGKFIKGGIMGINVGQTGGSSSTQTGGTAITTEQVASHSHTGNADTRSSQGAGGGSMQTDKSGFTTSAVGGNTAHTHTIEEPIHHVLAYIIYLGV